MNRTEEIHVRLRITNLEARLALAEIEIAALTREIGSPLMSDEERAVAVHRKETIEAGVPAIRAELEQMRNTYPKEAQY